MATTTTHCKMGIVDSLGNVNVLYPQTTGADVSITPNSVVSATTVQGLVDSLTGSAFISNFTGIDDTSTTSTTATYSAKKITALNSDLSTAISGKAASNHNHSGTYAPVAHASTAITYGVGNASNYGHVKLSDTYSSNVGAAANAIGASQTALYNFYTDYSRHGKFREWRDSGIFDADTSKITLNLFRWWGIGDIAIIQLDFTTKVQIPAYSETIIGGFKTSGRGTYYPPNGSVVISTCCIDNMNYIPALGFEIRGDTGKLVISKRDTALPAGSIFRPVYGIYFCGNQ